MPTSHIQTLRTMLREDKGVILPGAPNALAARIIADFGFRAVYLTGAGLANMHLGLPDGRSCDGDPVCDRSAAEQAGASAIQIEGQRPPKRCDHFDGKELISLEEMVGKVRAAV